jgi:hypothetical protein
MLVARIYEVFPWCYPLFCPKCKGQRRLISFINGGAEIRKILDCIGVAPKLPKITATRGPPLWDGCDSDDSALSGH